MEQKSATAYVSPDASRCHHHYPNATRCRLSAANADSQFCRRHVESNRAQPKAPDLAAMLTAGLAEFRTLEDVNEFLSRLLVAAAQDRISPKRAAVLAYITSQILRTISALDREASAEAHSKPIPQVRVICDIPRPAYETKTLRESSGPETEAQEPCWPPLSSFSGADL